MLEYRTAAMSSVSAPSGSMYTCPSGVAMSSLVPKHPARRRSR